MTDIELLKHVLNNLEKGLPPNQELRYDNMRSICNDVGGLDWKHPERYSLIPQTQIINGVEVPRGVNRIVDNRTYYAPSLLAQSLHCPVVLSHLSEKVLKTFLDNNLLYDNAEDAAKVTKLLFGLDSKLLFPDHLFDESCEVNKSTFPKLPFKINCGDDPKVRQWLEDNGVVWGSYGIPKATERHESKHLLCVSTTKLLTFCSNFAHFSSHEYPQINPYEYMKS